MAKQFVSCYKPQGKFSFNQYTFKMAGKKKGMKTTVLTVFPEPVWAQAIKSLPARVIGIAYF